MSEEEEDTEEVVLNRWERLKQWFDIVKTGFTIGKLLWGLFFVGTGAVIVGEATDTKPVRNLAETVGLVQPDTDRATLMAQIDELNLEIEQLQAAVDRINQKQPVTKETVVTQFKLPTHEHEEYSSVTHDHPPGHTHPAAADPPASDTPITGSAESAKLESLETRMDLLEAKIPADHKRLH